MSPVLELLQHTHQPAIPHIRRDVGTVPEFEYYLKKWTQRRYVGYPILYLAFHGDPGVLYVGDGRSAPLTLEWVEDRLAGRCKRRIIHFGSCGTVATHGRRLNRFLERTGALAICGYMTDVDWTLSAAFEIVLLSSLQTNALTRSGIQAVQRRIQREAAGMTRHLAFRMVVAR